MSIKEIIGEAVKETLRTMDLTELIEDILYEMQEEVIDIVEDELINYDLESMIAKIITDDETPW